jgi:hypothetical protein
MCSTKLNEIAPDGSTSTVDDVYQRKGQGSGFAGTRVSTCAVAKSVYVHSSERERFQSVHVEVDRRLRSRA